MRGQPSDNPKIRGHPSLERAPTAEDFLPGAVSHAVLMQTLKHPVTLTFAALLVLLVGWSAFGNFNPLTFFGMLGTFVGTVGSWVCNFFFRGETLGQRHVENLRVLRREHRIRDSEEISVACQNAGFQEGAKEAEELTAVYSKLDAFLEQQAQGRGAERAEYFQVLAQDTYDQGVSALRGALNIYRVLRDIDVEALETERAAWEQELSSAPDSRRGALQSQIDSHTQRIDAYRER